MGRDQGNATDALTHSVFILGAEEQKASHFSVNSAHHLIRYVRLQKGKVFLNRVMNAVNGGVGSLLFLCERIEHTWHPARALPSIAKFVDELCALMTQDRRLAAEISPEVGVFTRNAWEVLQNENLS